MKIRTICEASEEKFDAKINTLMDGGWKPDLSTYRTAAWGFASTNPDGDGERMSVKHEGCYNSIILTKE